ncbi:MAG: helix-turn-helix transcriptional regulator, partial [Spirochaetia bacterium]|nr:helix-turn-helix transcriptional regulator [Spirochaetia bacterium]
MNDPFELLVGGRTLCRPEWSRPEGNYEDYHKLYIPRKGSAELWDAGGRTKLRPGRVYFIPGYRKIHNRCQKLFDVDWFHFRAADPHADAALGRMKKIVSWPASQWAFFKPAHQAIDLYFKEKSQELFARLQAMLLWSFAPLIARENRRASNAKDGAGWRLIQPALVFMNDHFLEKLSLASIAARSGLHPVYFHRLFSRLLHISPLDYLIRERMRLA